MSEFDELKQTIDALKQEVAEYKAQFKQLDDDYMYIRLLYGFSQDHFTNMDEVLALRIRKVADFVDYPKQFGGVPLSEELKAEREALRITSEVHHQPCPKCGKQPICRFTVDNPSRPDRYPDYMVRCPDGCSMEADIKIFCDSPEEGFRMWDKYIVDKFGDQKEKQEELNDGEV